jgi:hypothetical protein
LNIRLVDPGPPLTPERLTALEAETGVQLPAIYRRFLLRTNGGRPDPNWFRVSNWPGRASQVQWFLRVDDPHTKGLDFWIAELRDRLGEKWAPIAVDEGGNFLVVGMVGADADRVYYWDSSPDWGLDESTGTMFAVAADVDAFLELLGQEPEEME